MQLFLAYKVIFVFKPMNKQSTANYEPDFYDIFCILPGNHNGLIFCCVSCMAKTIGKWSKRAYFTDDCNRYWSFFPHIRDCHFFHR